MSPDDRELIADIRTRLHGIAMLGYQLEDQDIATQLEAGIDVLILWLRGLTRK
jgi:hypothetical protein